MLSEQSRPLTVGELSERVSLAVCVIRTRCRVSQARGIRGLRDRSKQAAAATRSSGVNE